MWRIRFEGWLKEYRRDRHPTAEERWVARQEAYREARLRLLDDPGSLTLHDFSEGLKKLWSSGLLRCKNRWRTDDIRRVVAYLAGSDDPMFTLYTRALGGFKADGVGPNIVTELLLLRDSSRFGIFNKRSCTAVNALRMDRPFVQGDRRGEEYARFVNVLQELRKAFDLEDLMRIDSVFDFAYVNQL